MLDKDPFIINNFKGINLGSANSLFPSYSQDSVDFSHALDALNIVFLKEGGIQTRPPFREKSQLISDNLNIDIVIMQHWKIANLGGTYYDNRWLFLTYSPGANEGKIYDTAHTGVPQITLTGMKFASVINVYGRLYISPLSEVGTPLAGEYIWTYDGTTARHVGGTAPVEATLTITDVAVGGANVTPGLHIGAVAFETNTGFITPAGPATRIQVTIAAGGGRAARFTNVDTGPAGTVARHLLLTKTINNYDGIQDNWELFFALKIPDNVATTGDVIVPDTGLVNSADYLLSEFASIPSCAAISLYGTHLMYNGSRTDQTVIYVSKGNDPETVDQTEDYIQKKDGIPQEFLNSRELRGLCYLFKETSTYVTREDPSSPPNAWAIDLVDSGIGISPLAIGEILSNPGGLVLDNLIVGGMYGLYVFSGTYSRIPFSYNIQAKFNGMTRTELKYTRMAVDPVRRRIYLLIGNPLVLSELWMADYFNGLDNENVKWCRWTAYDTAGEVPVRTDLPITSVLVDPNNNSTNKPNVSIAARYLAVTFGYAFQPDETVATGTDNLDAGTWEIPYIYETGFTSSPLGYQYGFAFLGLRIALAYDHGISQPQTDVLIEILGFDSTDVLDSVILKGVSQTPKQYYTRPLAGISAEMIRVRISGYNTMFISNLILFVNEKAKVRPR
jgi:hypothetical protein